MTKSDLAPNERFACRVVSLEREGAGYYVSLELYDASWLVGGEEEEVRLGGWLLRGRRLGQEPWTGRLWARGGAGRLFALEEGEYQIVARVSPKAPTAAPPRFWPGLREAGAAHDDPASASLLWRRSARLRFAGSVGRARVEVIGGAGRGVELCALPLEVLCQKLELPEELPMLLGALSRVAASLSLRARGAARLPLAPAKGAPSPLERLVALSAVLSPQWLPRALSRIAAFPHRGLKVVPRSVSARERSGLRQDDLTRAAARQGALPRRGALLLPTRLLVESREPTLDTPENRALFAALREVKAEARRLREALSGDPWLKEASEELWRRAERLVSPAPPGEVTGRPPRSPSLFARRQPGYREVLLAGRLLGRSLAPSLGEEAPSLLEAPGRSVAFLYEVWCYLILARGLALASGKPPSFPALTLVAGGVLRLKEGEMHPIAPGVRLGYQMRFEGGERASYSVTLRPDFYVELAGWRLLFDAKYRLEPEGGRPKHEDLLSAHAYKDALGADGSFLLYPGGGSATLFRRSPPLPLPAVGAFPLRPLAGGRAQGEDSLEVFLRAVSSSSSQRRGRIAAETRARYGVEGDDGS